VIKKILMLAFCILLIFPTIVSANYFSGGRTSPIFTAYYDSSVSSYGYTSHFDAGRVAWSIPLKVSVSKSSSNSSTYDEYYVGTTTDPTLLGLTLAYKNGPWGTGLHYPATHSDTWVYCTVALYQNNLSTYSYNDVVGVTTHEIGHSLALAHTTAPAVSIMTATTYAGNPTYQPTTYDMNELKSKWGITP